MSHTRTEKYSGIRVKTEYPLPRIQSKFPLPIFLTLKNQFQVASTNICAYDHYYRYRLYLTGEKLILLLFLLFKRVNNETLVANR